MAKTTATIDDYIAAQPLQARRVLARVRAAIRKALPRASEGVSYQIPVYKLDGRVVLYFAGFQRHYSIYPATARVVSELGSELSGRLHSKGTIRFSFDDVPTRLIARIAKLRAAEAAELDLAKAAKKAAKKMRAKQAKPPARKTVARRRARKS